MGTTKFLKDLYTLPQRVLHAERKGNMVNFSVELKHGLGILLLGALFAPKPNCVQ